MPLPPRDLGPTYNALKRQWDDQQKELVQNIQQGDDFNPWLRLKMNLTNLPLSAIENQQGGLFESGLHNELGRARVNKADSEEERARRMYQLIQQANNKGSGSTP